MLLGMRTPNASGSTPPPAVTYRLLWGSGNNLLWGATNYITWE